MPVPPTAVRLTYFDTAMVLIEVGGLRLLTDPVFDPAGTEFDNGPVRLAKTATAPIRREDLGRIDAVLLSHDQHSDNLDDGGRAFLPGAGAVITTPEAAARLGGNARGLAPWSETRVSGPDGFELTVTAAPARHGPEGTEALTGPVTGFLLSWPGRANAVYVSGDTVPFAGTEEIAARAAPVGLALLHLGRVRLPGMDDAAFSMSAEEGAAYAGALGARYVVPIHFEGWRHFSEGRAAAGPVLDTSPVAARTVWLDPGTARDFHLD